MVRSEGNMSLKNPMAPTGIDPGTVRLVVQRLNHYAAQTPFVDEDLSSMTLSIAGSDVTNKPYRCSFRTLLHI
jgi:hypothetical protein